GANQRREHPDSRSGQVMLHLAGLRDIDLGGTVGREPVGELARGARRADDHRRGLPQCRRRSEQLVGDLLDLAARMLDEDQDLCADVPPPLGSASGQISFWPMRYWASWAAPSPSSVTIWPAARGGRGVDSITTEVAPASPASLGARPASASD